LRHPISDHPTVIASASEAIQSASVMPGRLEEANRNLEIPGSMLRTAPE
jgi:hypothetical protein